MAKYTRNERIAILVIEDQIWTYYNKIIEKLTHQFPKKFSDIDSDDISSIKSKANELFKEITNYDIYEAIGEAYGYDRTTIASKLSKHKKRIDIWVEFKKEPDAYYFHGSASLLNKDLADICYILQVIEFENIDIHRIISKGITEHRIDNDLLSEDDIYAIKDIINKRSDAIYDGNPDSKVAAGLTVFEQYMLKYEPCNIAVKDDIPNEPVSIDPPMTGDKAMSIGEYVDVLNALGISDATIEFTYEGKPWHVHFYKC